MAKVLSLIAAGLVQIMEMAGLRGAPTIFRLLSRLRVLRRAVSTVPMSPVRTINFPTFDPYWSRYLWAGKPYEPDVEMILRKLGAVPGKLLRRQHWLLDPSGFATGLWVQRLHCCRS